MFVVLQIQFVRDKPLLHRSSRGTSSENFLAASQIPIQLPGNRLNTKIMLAKTTDNPLPFTETPTSQTGLQRQGEKHIGRTTHPHIRSEHGKDEESLSKPNSTQNPVVTYSTV